MHFNIVEIAAWIVIYVAIFGFLWWRGEEKNQRKREYGARLENEAARLEYENERTAEERKRELLLRYPETLISKPHYRYFELARETEKQDEPKRLGWKDRFGMAAIIAILGGIWLLFIFAGKLLLSFLWELIRR